MADLRVKTALSTTQVEKVREFLVFSLAEDLYGVELAHVREIVSPPPLTPVPRAPRAVMGLCSVRGLLVTVIDLRRKLRLPEAARSTRARILLTEQARGEVVGLYVDEVKQVVRLLEPQIEVATGVLGGEVSEHILGIGRPAGSLLILLNLASIVTG